MSTSAISSCMAISDVSNSPSGTVVELTAILEALEAIQNALSSPAPLCEPKPSEKAPSLLSNCSFHQTEFVFPTAELTEDEESFVAGSGGCQEHGYLVRDGSKATFDALCAIDAIMLTKEGKYVIKQQSPTSCGYTCIAMLVLDLGIQPNYGPIADCPGPMTPETCLQAIAQAGLVAISTELSSNPVAVINTIIPQLKENGPGFFGILGIQGKEEGHAIIIDKISQEDNTIDIREPTSGTSVTKSLDSFISWISGAESTHFIQIASPDKYAPEPEPECELEPEL